MSTQAPLAAVTFDYWNTLCYEPDMDQRRELIADAWLTILTDAGVEADRAHLVDAYTAARGEYWTAWHENRQYTGEDAARHCLASLEGDGSLAHLTDALLDAFYGCAETAEVVPVDGVADALEAVRDAGLRVGIICDVGLMASRYLRWHLQRHDLLRFFDHWSFSDEVGVYKPDRRIFDHALAGLGGVPPTAAAHVGDRRRTDVQGAIDMGMRAVRVTAVYDDDDPAQGPAGDSVISTYDELLPALGL